MTPTYRFGDVVRITYKHTDESGETVRPAVVVSSQLYHQKLPDIIIMPVTGSTRREERFYGTLDIVDLESAGLSKPCVIKPVLQTIDKARVRSRSGALDKSTRDRLKKLLPTLVGY